MIFILFCEKYVLSNYLINSWFCLYVVSFQNIKIACHMWFSNTHPDPVLVPLACCFSRMMDRKCSTSLSRVWLFTTPWTVALQAPLSMDFSRQVYWSGLPFPSPGNLSNPGIKPGSLALQADSLWSESPGYCPNLKSAQFKSQDRGSGMRVHPLVMGKEQSILYLQTGCCIWGWK